MAKNLTLLNMHDMLALITDAALQRKFIKLYAPAADVDIDWNGGCNGKGAGGARYYRSGTSMEEIVGRMLMLGEVPKVDVRRDVTAGSVYGVYYTDGENQTKIWHKGDASVGFPWSNRNPVHQ